MDGSEAAKSWEKSILVQVGLKYTKQKENNTEEMVMKAKTRLICVVLMVDARALIYGRHPTCFTLHLGDRVAVM